MRKINLSNDMKRDAEVAFGTTFHRSTPLYKTADGKKSVNYTLEYLKTLTAVYVEWDTDPGSMVWPEGTYSFEENLGDEELHRLVEIEDDDEDAFVDTIRGFIQDFLISGTVKSFRVKDPTGKIVCEYDDGFYN